MLRVVEPIEFVTIRTTPSRIRLLMDIAGDALSTFDAGRFVHDRL